VKHGSVALRRPSTVHPVPAHPRAASPVRGPVIARTEAEAQIAVVTHTGVTAVHVAVQPRLEAFGFHAFAEEHLQGELLGHVWK
jgi:hypothetical protein